MRSTKADKADKADKSRKQERRDKRDKQGMEGREGKETVGAAKSSKAAAKESKQLDRLRDIEPPCLPPLFLPRGSLRRRGWTDSGIARFLGRPDAHAPNPVVPSAARMRLYDEERVAAVEATETWREWRAASEHRREAARVRAEERAQERAEHIARKGVYAELASHVANR